jgi:hypothetical protein
VQVRYYNIILRRGRGDEGRAFGHARAGAQEQVIGMVAVRQVFRISKIGTVAGCYVQDGVVKRSAQVRVLRDNVSSTPATSIRSSASRTTCARSRPASRRHVAQELRRRKENDQFEVFETVEVARPVKRVEESGRPQRLGDLIQREVSELIRRELRDPRVGMITITGVDVSPDFSHAKVFFTRLEKRKLRSTPRA